MAEPPKYQSLTVRPDQFGEEVVAAEADGYEVMSRPYFSGDSIAGTMKVSVMLVRGYKQNPAEGEKLLRDLFREHPATGFGHCDIYGCSCSHARAYHAIKDALERGVL